MSRKVYRRYDPRRKSSQMRNLTITHKYDYHFGAILNISRFVSIS